MKKIILTLSLFMLSIISGYANVDSRELSKTETESEAQAESEEKEQEEAVSNDNAEDKQPVLSTQAELYSILGEHRDKEKYMIKDDFKVIFPAGRITRIFGSSLGVREKEFTMSEQELEEIITIFEQDAIAYPSDAVLMQKSIQLMPETNRAETYGQVILEIETASKKKHDLYIIVRADDIIHGISYPVPAEGGDVSFGIKSPEIAQKLRALIDFKVVDRSALDRAVSAECTSIFNGNSVTLTGEQLQVFVKGIQDSENIMPSTMYWEYDNTVAVLEILLDDGEIIRGMFRGNGYDGEVNIEAETFQISEKSAQYLQELFLANNIPQTASYYYLNEKCKYVDPENYSKDAPPTRDEEYFLSYAGAASYESIIRLGGTQREDQEVIWNREQKKLTLPEGMVINTTINGENGEKTAAIPSGDEVYRFIEILESTAVEEIDPEVWSDELNVVTLNTAGEYTLLLFSLNDSYFDYDNEKWVNCMILSENEKNHGKHYRINSEELYNAVSELVNPLSD